MDRLKSTPTRHSTAGLAADVERLKQEYIRKAREDARNRIKENAEAEQAQPQSDDGNAQLESLYAQEQIPEDKKKETGESKKKRKRKKKAVYDDEIQNEDGYGYDQWVPPVGQAGDGRTSLNEKLGY